jgi:hypothetical protein
LDKEIAEMILGKNSDDSCLKDDDHGIRERTIETMTKVKEVDEMAIIPEGPDKLAEAAASASRRTGPKKIGDGGESGAQLLSGDGFLASLAGAHFCGEFVESGFFIGFRRPIGWIVL